MKAIRIKKRLAAIVDEPCPPGISIIKEGNQPPSPVALNGDRAGWWIRTSAKQTLDTAGQPVGFKHRLMHGRKAIMSGTGADAARTFAAQAEFLNRSTHASVHIFSTNGIAGSTQSSCHD